MPMGCGGVPIETLMKYAVCIDILKFNPKQGYSRTYLIQHIGRQSGSVSFL